MSNELQIRLSADIKQLQSALSRAKKTIKDFETETEKGSERSNVGFKRKIGLIEQLESKAKKLRVALRQATSEEQVERYNRELVQTTSEMTRLNALGRQVSTSVGNTGAAFKRAGSSIGGTNSVAIEFNRIIQDAPFGLIGIGNNLQQLAGNFANVRSQAGSTGKAVKASLASIISPVNLGVLALSALTAGFTAYQMGAFDFGNASESASKKAEKFREELDEFVESLNEVQKAQLDGAESASKEASMLQSLSQQAENTNIPFEERLKAVNKLQSEYPSYLGNLSKEDILAGDVGDAYKVLTNNLLASARARSASARVGDLFLQQLEIQARLEERVLKILALRNKEELLRQKLVETRSARTGVSTVETEILAAQKEINKLSNEQVDDVRRVNTLKEQQSDLQDEVNKQLEKGGSLVDDIDKKTKSINKTTKESISSTGRLAQLYSNILDDLNEIEKSGLLKGKGGVIDFGVEVDDVPPVEERPSKTPERLVKLRKQELDLLQRAGVEIKDMEFLSDKQILAYKAQADQLLKIDMLSQQIGQTLSSSFEDAILKGEDLFDSLEKGFKRLLAKLAAQLIASTILKVLGSIIGGPAGGIIGSGLGSGVGGLLSGGGGSIGSNFSSLGAGIASVPNIPTPTSPTNIGSVASLSTMQVEVVGQISGSDIFLSNKRESEKRTRYYG